MPASAAGQLPRKRSVSPPSPTAAVLVRGHGDNGALEWGRLLPGLRPVVVVWGKRIWRCPDADCDMATWTERSAGIAARALLTERARAEVCRQVGEENRSVACVARGFGVGWSTVMAAVEDYGRKPGAAPLRRVR